jgi:hypothetical protein
MSDEDHEYYRQPASAERLRARAAAHDRAAAIHEELAVRYEKLAERFSRGAPT